MLYSSCNIINNNLFLPAITLGRPIINCCENNATVGQYICFPIYGPQRFTNKTECINFVRTATDHVAACPGSGQQAEQISSVTSWLDLSFVYGNGGTQSSSIRSFQNGQLLTYPANCQDFLPHIPLAAADDSCPVQNTTSACYTGGDFRINQNPGVSMFQTLLFREHNQIARQLQIINRNWNDEKCFQVAREINIAKWQKNTFYDWLPKSLGPGSSFVT